MLYTREENNSARLEYEKKCKRTEGIFYRDFSPSFSYFRDEVGQAWYQPLEKRVSNL